MNVNPSMRRSLLPAMVILLILAAERPALAQRDLTDIPVPDPELERQTFRLPEGFEVNLYAADPMIAKPIQMNFDPDGRLWLVSSEVYPQIRPGVPATDRVLVLEDLDHDGVSDQTHVFAEGLLIPTGIAPGDGGAYVANSTELLHLADSDGDLRADSRRVVLSGFGTEDTHHILHTLRWGYDGYLYLNQSIYIHSHLETPWGVRRLNAGGIWQFRPDTLELGVFLRGLVNSWGHHFDRFGQSFATDGAGGDGINYVIPGAYYVTAADAARVLRGLNPGSPKHCGLELVETPNLPPDWQGNAITNDFRGHRVVRFTLADEGSGYVSREQQEVIRSDHVAFRPIDVKQGPDGAIYIADWYNPIIQHGEVDFRDDRRDHTHGRIWRVTWKGAPSPSWQPNSSRSSRQLLELLPSDDAFQRQAARQILRERGTGIVPDLRQWLAEVTSPAAETRADDTTQSDPADDRIRLEALWCLQAVRVVDEPLLTRLLRSSDGRIRAAAVRVLSHWKHQLPSARDWLTRLVEDAHPRVRLEAVRALSFSPLDESERQMTLAADGRLLVPEGNDLSEPGDAPDAPGAGSAGDTGPFDRPGNIEVALKPLKQPMDRFLDYALWLTTRELSHSWLPAFQQQRVTFQNDADQILFAFTAIGSGAPVDLLLGGLYARSLTADQRAALAQLIATGADEGQLGKLAELAIEHGDAAVLHIVLTVSEEQNRIPSVNSRNLTPLLRSDDVLLRQTALTAAGLWRLSPLSDMLQSVARDREADPGDRRAAFRGLAGSREPSALAALTEIARDAESGVELQQAALVELVEAQPEQTAPLAGELLAGLQSADALLAANIARALLGHRQGLRLLDLALQGRTLQPDVARELLRALRESGRTAPELEATIASAGQITSRRTLTVEQRRDLLAAVSSAATASLGEAVFRNERLGCLRCHAIAGAGGLVGPDMVSLGASAQPDYLLESLLEPNAKVKENYHTIVVATTDGRVHSGIQLQKSDAGITLRTADNRILSVGKSEIEEVAQGVSLMPEGLADVLTDQELASLIRFLSELGRTAEFTVSRQRFVRTWQVMIPAAESAWQLQRTSYAQASSDDPAFAWKSAYSTVAGFLPATDVPVVVPSGRAASENSGVGFVRAQLAVTSAGTVSFRINSVAGLELRINDKPVSLQTEFAADLPAGHHRLTFTVDRTDRSEPLQLELLESAAGGRAEFLN